MRQNNVIHVELRQPFNGETHHYFGSISAIYEVIPKEVIGAGKEWLWEAMRGKDEYSTRKATIRRARIITKPKQV